MWRLYVTSPGSVPLVPGRSQSWWKQPTASVAYGAGWPPSAIASMTVLRSCEEIRVLSLPTAAKRSSIRPR